MTQGTPGEKAGPIGQIEPGMTVVDVDGREVGMVELVKMGDPGAVTAQGQDAGDETGGLVESFWRAFGEGQPQIPAQFAKRLQRLGFVKVDGKGLLDRDLYVAADQIERIAGDVVSLRVTSDELVREHS